MYKILIITGSSSRRSGGLFYSVKHLARHLSTRGDIKLQVVAYHDDFSNKDIQSWASVDVREYKHFYKGVFTINLMPIIEKFSPNVIYQNGVWSSATLVVNRYLRGVDKKVKYIVAPRGMLDEWALSNGSFLKKFLYLVYIKNGLKNISSFHALNISEKNSIRKLFKVPIFIVPNAVSLTRDSVDIQKDFSRWLFLGRIHPKKGLLELIKALGKLSTSRELDVELSIVGWVDDMNYYDALQKEISIQGLEQSVRFFGELYGAEKEDVFRKSDVFVLPSYSEGLPMAVLEAWDKGLVTLISKECNLPDAFTSKAAFEISNNAESLVKDLSEFLELSYSEKLELITNANKLVREKYSWDSVTNQFIDCIKNLDIC